MSGLIVGLVGTALTAGISIYQGVDAKRKGKAASNQASALLAEAKKNLELNPYEEMSVNLKASDRSRDAMRGLSAQGGLGTFDQRMSPGQRALNSLMTQEQQVQASEIKQEQDLEKLVAKEDTGIKDALASINIGQVKQKNDAAAGFEQQGDALIASGIATTAAGVGTAIGQSARSKRPTNQALKGLDQSAVGTDATGAKFDYGTSKDMANNLYEASQDANFDWSTNVPADLYTTGIQKGFADKLKANPQFAGEMKALFGGNEMPTDKDFNTFMSSQFLPYEIQAMYK